MTSFFHNLDCWSRHCGELAICLFALLLAPIPALAINSDTICNALDILTSEQTYLTNFQAELFKVTRSDGVTYDTLTPVTTQDWTTYSGNSADKGTGPNKILKYGSCLESPYVNAYIDATAPYIFSLTFQVRGAGTLSFDLKSALDTDNWWDTDNCPIDYSADQRLEYFRDSYCRLVVLVDGEEQFITNSTDFEPMLEDIETGDDWSTEELRFNSGQYNHSVQFLVLIVPKSCAILEDGNGNIMYQDKSTRQAVHAYATTPQTYSDYQDNEFVSKCFNQIWLDNFNWTAETTESGSLVNIDPDPRAFGHYSPDPYPFEQDEAAIVFISSDYLSLVFFYTLDGSEPQLLPDETLGFVCGENTFLYDDVNIDYFLETLRSGTRDDEEIFGIILDSPAIIRAIACEKVKADNEYGYKFLATDGVVYPKNTQFHYLPAHAATPGVDADNRITCLSPAIVTLFRGKPNQGVKVADLEIGSPLPDLSTYDQAYLQAGIHEHDGFLPGETFTLPTWSPDAFFLTYFSLEDGLVIDTSLPSLPPGTELRLDGESTAVGELVSTTGEHTLTATSPRLVGQFSLTFTLRQDERATLDGGWHLLPVYGAPLDQTALDNLQQCQVFTFDETAGCFYRATDFSADKPSAFWLFAPTDNFPNPLYKHWQLLVPTQVTPPTGAWQLTPAPFAPVASVKWSWLDGKYQLQDSGETLWWYLP